jgi:hypothetical protein
MNELRTHKRYPLTAVLIRAQTKKVIAEHNAGYPGNPIAFAMNTKLMKVVIRPSHGNLDDVVQIGDRAVAADQ